MKRTISAFLGVWRREGFSWPIKLLKRAAACKLSGTPRGLIVEPTRNCTGGCMGCLPPHEPAELAPGKLMSWLESSPSEPVTIHFSGKHSDPLASRSITALAQSARKHCSMLSVSTIGLGLKHPLELLPVHRWIFSIPAATEKSWRTLRGNDRFKEAIQAIESTIIADNAMVEVVLTVWKQSANDIEDFYALAKKHNWPHIRVVFGRFDPDEHHVGRIENIAVDHPNCPYTKDRNGRLVIRRKPTGCPLADYLFLDAAGTLRPCPFTGDKAPALKEPTRESWKRAAEWRKQKQARLYPACEWCP